MRRFAVSLTSAGLICSGNTRQGRRLWTSGGVIRPAAPRWQQREEAGPGLKEYSVASSETRRPTSNLANGPDVWSPTRSQLEVATGHRYLRVPNPKVSQSKRVSGDLDAEAPTLSRRLPCAVHMQDDRTSNFVEFVTRWADDGAWPPRKDRSFSRRFAYAQAADQQY